MTVNDRIDLLDQGYVRVANVFGNELDIVNAARVSYDKESTSFDERDRSLLRYLITHNHESPLRHVSMTFEVYVPLMVARQHFKYVVGSTMLTDGTNWNEQSRRYVVDALQFYTPSVWRSAPDNSKQGSGDPLPVAESDALSNSLLTYVQDGLDLYEQAIAANVAPEMARLFLPAYGLYVRYRWTASLSAVLHFLDQRLEDDAQYEIQLLAKAVRDLTKVHFPTVFEVIDK